MILPWTLLFSLIISTSLPQCFSYCQPEICRSFDVTKQISIVTAKLALLSSVFVIGTSPVYATSLENGQALFASSCAGCHAGGGNILSGRQNLMQKTLEKDGYNTADAMSAYITKGKGRMPAYGSFISPKGNVMPAKYNAEEINDISSYVLEQSSLNWIETK